MKGRQEENLQNEGDKNAVSSIDKKAFHVFRLVLLQTIFFDPLKEKLYLKKIKSNNNTKIRPCCNMCTNNPLTDCESPFEQII